MKPSFALDKIREQDISYIRDLTKRSLVSRYSNKIGFVEFETPSATEYERRTYCSTNALYIVRGSENIGFVTMYDCSMLYWYTGFNGIREIISREKDVLYIEQLVIEPKYRNKGYGSAMMDTIVHKAIASPFSKMFAMCSHYPHTHSVSKKILNKFDFQLSEKITFDGMVFGLYARNI